MRSSVEMPLGRPIAVGASVYRRRGRITFAAIPLPSNHDGQANPATPVTVTLNAPLGDRELRDGLLVGSITDVIKS